MTEATALPISLGELKDALAALTPTQKRAMLVAYCAKTYGDGWMERAFCPPWQRAGWPSTR
jgi:hypothetical protein